LGSNFSILQFIFYDRLHASIANLKFLWNLSNSQTAIVFSKFPNRCNVRRIRARSWAPPVTDASCPSENIMCQTFTWVFGSINSPCCEYNLVQISVGPTFSFMRNLIIMHCATVTGTSFSLIVRVTERKNRGGKWHNRSGSHSSPHHPQGRALIVYVC
jgi:hypothetical protein